MNTTLGGAVGVLLGLGTALLLVWLHA